MSAHTPRGVRARVTSALLLAAASTACGDANALEVGETLDGTLEASDAQLDGSYYDLYSFRGDPGTQVWVTLRSAAFDALLAGGRMEGEAFVEEASDDDGGGGTDARLTVTVGADGTYQVRVSSFAMGMTGPYTLSVQPGSTAGSDGARSIQPGEVATGALLSSDPQLADDSHYHSYQIDGDAGDRLLITLTSADFDAYLRWGREATGAFESLESDDDGAGGTNARLEVTLAESGRYTIQANSYGADATGAYTLSIERIGVASAGLPQLIPGETISEALTAFDPVLSDNSHYRLFGYEGTPGEQVLVTLRSSAFDAYLHGGRMVGGAFQSDLTDDDAGGGTDAQILATLGLDGALVVQVNTLRGGETGWFTLLLEPVSGASSDASVGQRTVGIGDRITGALRSGDPALTDSSYYNQFVYQGRPGDRLRLTLRSSQFDAYLRWGMLSGDEFEVDEYDDNSGGGRDAQLDVIVASSRVHAIQVNSYSGGQTGAYELVVERLTEGVDSNESNTGGAQGKWLPAYLETTNASFRAIGQRVKQYRVLEEVSEALNQRFAIPRNISIRLEECGEVNASYSPSDDSIAFCYEMLAYLANTFVRNGRWTPEQQENVLGAMRFILMHEVGHALVGVLDLPITGREEDAADQLAVVMLVEGGEKGANAALAGAAALQPASNEFDDTDFADEHSLGPVRLFNVACWIYGSDPRKYGGMLLTGQLTADRADGCPSEFERMSKAWYRLLAPHVVGY